jgi:hypothetical protein
VCLLRFLSITVSTKRYAAVYTIISVSMEFISSVFRVEDKTKQANKQTNLVTCEAYSYTLTLKEYIPPKYIFKFTTTLRFITYDLELLYF